MEDGGPGKSRQGTFSLRTESVASRWVTLPLPKIPLCHCRHYFCPTVYENDSGPVATLSY